MRQVFAGDRHIRFKAIGDGLVLFGFDSSVLLSTRGHQLAVDDRAVGQVGETVELRVIVRLLLAIAIGDDDLVADVDEHAFAVDLLLRDDVSSASSRSSAPSSSSTRRAARGRRLARVAGALLPLPSPTGGATAAGLTVVVIFW